MRGMYRAQRHASLLLLAITSALWVQCGGDSTRHQSAATLPFIQDDYSRALEEARQRKLPLFIETWAPW